MPAVVKVDNTPSGCRVLSMVKVNDAYYYVIDTSSLQTAVACVGESIKEGIQFRSFL